VSYKSLAPAPWQYYDWLRAGAVGHSCAFWRAYNSMSQTPARWISISLETAQTASGAALAAVAPTCEVIKWLLQDAYAQFADTAFQSGSALRLPVCYTTSEL